VCERVSLLALRSFPSALTWGGKKRFSGGWKIKVSFCRQGVGEVRRAEGVEYFYKFVDAFYRAGRLKGFREIADGKVFLLKIKRLRRFMVENWKNGIIFAPSFLKTGFN